MEFHKFVGRLLILELKNGLAVVINYSDANASVRRVLSDYDDALNFYKAIFPEQAKKYAKD